MSDDKRTPVKEITGLMWTFLVFGLVGLCIFFWKYDDVFPEASIDLKLGKSQIAEQARAVATELGFACQNTVESTTFGGDDYSKTFLEYEFPMNQANALMKSEIPIWVWTTRFCRAFQLEEMKVSLNPSGRFVYLEHKIEDERPIPSVSHEEAQKLAIDFAEKKGGLVLTEPSAAPEQVPTLRKSMKLVRDGTVKQAKRTDHYFTWEDQSKDYKGAKLRIVVYVSGNQVTNFDYCLHVPDSFDRKYNQIRSYNELFKSVSGVLFAIISAAMVFVFFWAMSTGRLRWRLSIVLAVLAFVMQMLDTWNYLPGIVASFDTTKTFNAFLIEELFASLSQSFFAAMGTVIVVGGIETIYRYSYGEKIAAEKWFTAGGLRSRQIFQALVVGLGVFGIHLGWVAVYYLFGRDLGVWSPLEIRDVATLSSIFPAFSSFTVGVNASITEELMYRVLCLLLVQKLCRQFWIANLVQAVGWAFMHSDYPQEPAYARGVELTVVGIFYGHVLKRFGVLPCILSHFTYDAFLGITPLLFSRSAAAVASGVAACSPGIVALGYSWWLCRKHGLSSDDSSLLNANIGVRLLDKQADVPEGTIIKYFALPSKRLYALLLSAITLFALSFFLLDQDHKFAGNARLLVGRDQAGAIAKSYLTTRGIDVQNWQNTIWLTENLQPEEVQYGFEKEGFGKTKKAMDAGRYPLIWWVRFFKPLQREEYFVLVNPNGKAIALDVVVDEDAKGKEISAEQAKALASQFIQRDRPEFLPLEFETVSEHKKKNRTDYAVTFNVPKLKLGEASLKVSVSTVGDVVSFPHVYWEVPQSWIFERQKQTIKDNIAKGAVGVCLFAFMIASIIWLVGLIRSQAIHWRQAIVFGLLFVVYDLLNKINALPGLFASYSTDVPIGTFYLRSFDRIAVSALMNGAGATLFAAVSYASERLLQPGFTIPSLLRSCFRPGNYAEADNCRAMWKDGLWIGYSGAFIFLALAFVFDGLSGRFCFDAQILDFDPLPKFSYLFSPALDMLVQATMNGIVVLVLMPIVAGLYAKYLHNWRRTMFLTLIFVSVVYASSDKHLQDFLLHVIRTMANAVAAYFISAKFCKRNPIAYFVLSYVASLFLMVFNCGLFARDVFAVDILIGCVGLVLPLLVGIVQWTRNVDSREIKQAQEDSGS